MPPIKVIKKSGQTMNQLIEEYKKKNNINKVCYCGRLDPMARGLVYLLENDDCKEMTFYNKCKKEYKFEILFGIATETDDPLGLITSIENFNKETVEYYCNKIKDYIKIGSFEQEFHDYSSKRHKGKSLWFYKKNNIDIEKPSHNVEIYSVEYLGIKTYNYIEWKNTIIETINKIDPLTNFRQKEIIEQYNWINEPNKPRVLICENSNCTEHKFNVLLNYLYSFHIKIEVSSGFYIRQLVADIKKHFGISILTFDINRMNLFN
jgi:tRNA pseudouridine(55) synthase